MEKLQQEDEIDIDLDDPATADAALKIQSVFRGKKFKKSPPENKVPENKEPESKKPEKKEPEETEQKDEEQAATKIQAGFRGHQARKSVKEMKSASEMGDGEQAERQEKGGDEKEYVENVTHSQEIRDFDDPKFDGAASTIQAGFRGYKTREDLKEKSSGGSLKSASHQEEHAAVKIQSSFRGHKARKEIEAMKLTGSTDTVDTKKGRVYCQCCKSLYDCLFPFQSIYHCVLLIKRRLEAS